MKQKEEITRGELDLMAKHHRQTEYTSADANEVIMLVKTYINQHTPSCLTCSGNLRDAKTSLNEFYLAHKDAVEARLLKESELEIVKDDVNEGEIVVKKRTFDTAIDKMKLKNKKNE